MSKSLIQNFVLGYVATGRHMGDGVEALLTNDLAKAVALLDVTHEEVFELVRWMNTAIPQDAWGSHKNVRRWRRRRTEEEAIRRIYQEREQRDPTDKELHDALTSTKHSIYIDADLRDGLLEYQQTGCELSGLPMAMLENDLLSAATKASGHFYDELREAMQFIYSYLDKRCYGSKRTVETWQKLGGRDGIKERLKQDQIGA